MGPIGPNATGLLFDAILQLYREKLFEFAEHAW